MVTTVEIQATAMEQTFETDTFHTENGKMLGITFIKHGSLMIEFDGNIIFVDPVSDFADYTKLPKADLIVITHEHGDHLDPKAINEVEKKEAKIIMNDSSKKKIGKGEIMKSGDESQPFPWLNVKAVPAYNTTPGREIYHPKERDNGYIITLDGCRIYIAGDTEDIPEMKQLGKIDIAFIPVNQPYTMTIPQAVHAAKMIKPAILYPYHYGDTDILRLKELLKNQHSMDVRIRKLQ